jgi:hypothetical protein
MLPPSRLRAYSSVVPSNRPLVHHSKGFLNAERHIPGKVSLAVKQAGQRGPGNLKRGSHRRYCKARRFDNLRPNEISGMGRVLHGDGILFLSS